MAGFPQRGAGLFSRAARKIAATLYWTTGIEFPVAAIGRPIGIPAFADQHHARRAAFIHVPKTGGNSVRQIVFGGGPASILGGHGTARQLRAVDAEAFDAYFIFAVVRDPFDRLKSAFWYLKGGGMSRYDALWAKRNLGEFDTFAEFVRALGARPAFRARITRYLHFIPQVEFLCDQDGEIMVDHLLRMEDFDTDMKAVCDRLGLSYEPRHENVSAKPPASVDEGELRRICGTVYRSDYDVLGYRLDPAATTH